MRGKSILVSGGAVTVLAALFAGPAYAQAAGAQNSAKSSGSDQTGEVSQEIIVTAQFRAQRLQDTPIAITAATAATLEARSQTSLLDLGNYAPNVNLKPAVSVYGNSIAAYIRGIGQVDSSFALEPGVGVYLDDVYYGTTFGAVFDLTDLDRVEVLRGPQGTLAGKNSLGGAIKLYSKRAGSEEGGFVEATYGRFNRIDIRASAGFTIAKGLYARISGVSKHADGYLTNLDYGCVHPGQGIAASPKVGGNCKSGTEGGTDVKAIRAQLRYAPDSSPLEINLAADVSKDDSQAVATKLLFANNPGVRSYDPSNPAGGVPFDSRFITASNSYTSYATYNNGGNYTARGRNFSIVPGSFTVPPINTTKGYGISGTIDYELSPDLRLKSITAFRSVSGQFGVDADGSPLDVFSQSWDLKHEQFTQELRLSGKSRILDYTVGGFYYSADDHIRSRVAYPTLLIDVLSDDPVKNRSISAFAHVELHPSDNLTVLGGIRYTHDKKTYTFGRRNPDGTIPSPTGAVNAGVAGLDGVSATSKGERVDYRVGLSYRWSEALMTYAQVSTGYKGGGINPRPLVPDQVTTFNPETLIAYEAGFKSDLLDRALQVNGAFFYNDYKNMQLTLFQCPTSSFSSCAMPANAGNAHIKGAELEVTLTPVAGLAINGSVGYLDFHYTQVNRATGVSLAMKPPLLSDWQASGGIQYAAAFSGGTITPRLDWTYQSSSYYQAVNNSYNFLPGRSLFNLRVTYESPDKNWTLSGSVTNLFNKFYFVGLNDQVAGRGLANGVVGHPREWAVTLRRRF